MKNLPALLVATLAFAACNPTGAGGSTTGGAVCHTNGESCSSSADCCSGFACSGTGCVFTGGNGNGNGNGNGTSGAASTGAAGGSSGSTGAGGTTGASGAATTSGGTKGSTGSTTGSKGTSSSGGSTGVSSTGSTGGSTGKSTSGTSGASSSGTSGGSTGQSSGTSGGSSSGTSGGNNAGTSGGSTGTGGNPDGGMGVLTAQPLMSGGWPKWHADIENSGRSEANTAALAGTVDWTFSVGAAGTNVGTGTPNTYNNSPVVASDGTVYQVSMTGLLYSLSPTGSENWAVQLTDPSVDCFPSTPLLRADGTLVVLTGQDNAVGTTAVQLFVVSSSGAILYSTGYGEDGFDGPPTLGANNALFLGTDDGSGGTDPYSAMAWTVSNGNLSIEAGANFGTIGTAASEEHVGLALSAGGGSYWALNGQYFALTAPTLGFAVAAPWPALGVTVQNGNADANNTFGTSTSNVALDANTGFVIAYTGWEDGMALFGTGPFSVLGSLTALDPSSGAVKWTLALPTTALPAAWTSPLNSDSGNAAPAIASDGTVYVGAGNGLLSVNGTTGVLNWTFASANVSSSPAIGGDGTIFFGCDDDSFYGVTAAGVQRFKITTGGPVSSGPAIGPNGNVYFVSDDGNLYAIH